MLMHPGPLTIAAHVMPLPAAAAPPFHSLSAVRVFGYAQIAAERVPRRLTRPGSADRTGWCSTSTQSGPLGLLHEEPLSCRQIAILRCIEQVKLQNGRAEQAACLPELIDI